MALFPEVCDYDQLAREYPWIRERDRKCIISADLDGVLSALLMSHLLSWQVVGVYTINSLFIASSAVPETDRLLGPEDLLRKSDFCFIDHDIYRRHIKSIGHHFLRWSNDVPIPEHTAGHSSLNPNLLRGFSFNNEFNRKYPFGTFHFLVACFSAWAMLSDFRPDDDLTTLLLQVDSSFENAIKYQDNALDWLDWLGGSDERSPLYPVCRRMLHFTPYVILDQFRKLAAEFGRWGLRPRRQGAFKDPRNECHYHSQQQMLAWVGGKTGWRLNSQCHPDIDYLTFELSRHSTNPTKRNFSRYLPHEPFSYALLQKKGQKGFNFGWFPDDLLKRAVAGLE